MATQVGEGEDNRLNWRKSAHSVNGGNCTEVASAAGMIVVRDSQDPDTLVLRYPAGTWRSFTSGVRTGAFDSFR
jgi:hypothetical protein